MNTSENEFGHSAGSVEEKFSQKEQEVEDSRKKFQIHGSLGVTARDHFNIGSSPPAGLRENPDKTFAEIYSDEELLNYLGNLEASIAQDLATLRKKVMGTPMFATIDRWTESNLRSDARRMSSALAYLKSLGRLPEKYAGYEALQLPPDGDILGLRKFLEADL